MENRTLPVLEDQLKAILTRRALVPVATMMAVALISAGMTSVAMSERSSTPTAATVAPVASTLPGGNYSESAQALDAAKAVDAKDPSLQPPADAEQALTSAQLSGGAAADSSGPAANVMNTVNTATPKFQTVWFGDYIRCISGIGVPLGFAIWFAGITTWANVIKWIRDTGGYWRGTAFGSSMMWYSGQVLNSCGRFLRS